MPVVDEKIQLVTLQSLYILDEAYNQALVKLEAYRHSVDGELYDSIWQMNNTIKDILYQLEQNISSHSEVA